MQLFFLKLARPIWTRFFASSESGSMAPVGQAAVQALHSYWQ
jgi:hypothetical protein